MDQLKELAKKELLDGADDISVIELLQKKGLSPKEAEELVEDVRDSLENETPGISPE